MDTSLNILIFRYFYHYRNLIYYLDPPWAHPSSFWYSDFVNQYYWNLINYLEPPWAHHSSFDIQIFVPVLKFDWLPWPPPWTHPWTFWYSDIFTSKEIWLITLTPPWAHRSSFWYSDFFYQYWNLINYLDPPMDTSHLILIFGFFLTVLLQKFNLLPWPRYTHGHILDHTFWYSDVCFNQKRMFKNINFIPILY